MSTKKEEKVIKVEKKETKTVVYCGPTLPGGTLQQFTIFNNGIPDFIKEYEKSCPALLMLIKPIKDLAPTRVNLKNKGSRDNQLFEAVLDYFYKRGA